MLTDGKGRSPLGSFSLEGSRLIERSTYQWGGAYAKPEAFLTPLRVRVKTPLPPSVDMMNRHVAQWESTTLTR